jgi:acetylornithine deacetylase/succinyl-diaminopimelate desuccinylase-like protein
MKHMAAMSALTMIELKRRGVALKRDLIFAGVADEEAGGHYGAGFLVDKHPDLIRAEACLCEVGGIATPLGGRIIVPVQTAQKGYVWFTLRAKGTGGHGSRPGIDSDGSAVAALAEAVARLSRRPLQYRLTPTTRDFLDAVASVQGALGKAAVMMLKSPATARLALKALPEERRKTFNALLHDTAAVTGLVAGAKVNVIPPHAEAVVDGRFLPGGTREQFLDQVRSLVGPEIEVEVIDAADPMEQDHRGPVWDSIVRVMERELPGCTVAANMITGMTDANHFARLGIKTYGFSPLLLKEGEDFAELYHAPDERVSVEGLEAGHRWLRAVVEDHCLA